MPKLNILHISDTHIGNTLPNESVEDIASRTVNDIAEHSTKINCVIVTGDIFDGQSDYDIEKAVSFFQTLKERLNKKVEATHLKEEDFVFVPGNHDLIRTDDGKGNFDKYKSFLKKFHSEDYFDRNYNNDELFIIKIFEMQKIVIVGLNSCMLKFCDVKDIGWINDIEWDDKTFTEKEQKIIRNKIEKCYQSKWDDYGKIERAQLTHAFDEFDEKISNIEDYTVVACFHHHFYPFPEIYDRTGDCSLIRNFDDVIKVLQKYNVKIVLHGHKHLPIIRPIANKAYLSNPDSLIYVFSAGSFSKNGEEQSFQVIDVYGPKENKIANVKRFNYKKRDFTTEDISIPPKKIYEKDASIEILEVFSSEFPDEYKMYKNCIKDTDNVSSNSGIDEIIMNIGKAITPFETVKKDLQTNHEKNLILLLSIHYRINILNQIRKNSPDSEMILNDIREHFSNIDMSEGYKEKLFEMIEADDNSKFESCYSIIERESNPRDRAFTAYATIAIFFTDLYLTLRQYGDFYYKHEGINVNIRLPENTFHRNIPSSTIKIYSDEEKRSSIIKFKCKDPTVHKIAVLIIKDFEKRLDKFDECLRELGLKIYYLTPKVEKNNYDLENFNFEAYIPTLLPLLTGDNLYNQKEVFIRELIQNSLDAILLREKLDSRDFDKTIKIELGKEEKPNNGASRKYLRIIDEGIGMDTFRIERYFTSIGRSFYVSEEFSELQKTKEIKYEPISNFGIGFLSAFMVCKEMSVITKSYDNDGVALDIHIPNYDGCFFINKIDGNKENTGTSITLYEDERLRLDFDEIKKYIKETFLDFQLKIKIIDKESKYTEEILPYNLKSGKELALFVPMTEDGLKKISWDAEIKTGKHIKNYSCGLLVDFDLEEARHYMHYNGANRYYKTSNNIAYLNSGIKLSEGANSKNNMFSFNCILYYNFPASYIQLDVAREYINSFKKNYWNGDEIIILLAKQANELIVYIKKEREELPLLVCNNIYLFLKINDLPKDKLDQVKNKLYHLSVSRDKSISITLKPNNTYSIGKKSSVDNELNMSFNIIDLLLLKCYLLQMQFGHKYNSNEDIKIKNIVEELLKVEYIPLSHFLNSHERYNYLKITIAKIQQFEQELYYNSREKYQSSFKNIHLVELDERLLNQLTEMLKNGFNEMSLRKFESKFMYNIDKDFSYAFKGTSVFSEIKKELHSIGVEIEKRESINYQLKYILWSLFIQPSKYRTKKSIDGSRFFDNLHFYVADTYFRLVVFYYIANMLNINQVNEFKIEFN